MSLTVSPDLLAKAEQGDVTNAEFIACIRESLPYAFGLIASLVAQMKDGKTEPGKTFAVNQTEPATENERGQVLRLMASDAMREALERYFDMRLAFQNCHAAAVFPTSAVGDQQREIFTSARAQLLNQSPELVNC